MKERTSSCPALLHTDLRRSPPLATPTSLPPRRHHGPWWAALGLIWLLASGADRLWLHLDRRLPSWDQADYLNSAIDHGRALGLLPSGGWPGWAGLLDLSPKIPPLASLVNGTVMALSGDSPDQASWALAVWQGLLLLVVACWGRQLRGPGFGLLCAGLVALIPALAELRVDFTLDLPVAASCALALWLLGRWQAAAPAGGRWSQAVAAALAVAAAVLVKQSALLMLVPPCLWAAAQGLRQPGRRAQVWLALALVLGLSLPWLQHNWISTIGGTNRAVIESGAAEGDPAPFSIASLLWYPRLWPAQLGPVLPLGCLALLGLARRRRWGAGALPALPPGWAWLIGCTLSGWLFTTLSPNKDARYIAPVLPLLVMLLAEGWWRLGLWLRRRGGRRLAAAGLAGGLVASGLSSIQSRNAAIQRQDPAPVEALIAHLRGRVGDRPTALLMVPGSPDLNEQTVTNAGRRAGGRIEARRLGRRQSEHPLVLERSQWLLLASGDQGTNRPASRELSHRLRADGRFERLASWPWSEGREVELWQRRRADGRPFDRDFIALARGMERGPAGLKPLFDRIGAEHQLDPHFLYMRRVEAWAQRQLQRDPNDRDALWSLALMATLRNRPLQAEGWYARLQELEPQRIWPACYRAVVLTAAWRPWRARSALASLTAAGAQQPVPRALADLTGVLSGRLQRIVPLRQSLPAAISAVKRDLKEEQRP